MTATPVIPVEVKMVSHNFHTWTGQSAMAAHERVFSLRRPSRPTTLQYIPETQSSGSCRHPVWLHQPSWSSFEKLRRDLYLLPSASGRILQSSQPSTRKNWMWVQELPGKTKLEGEMVIFGGRTQSLLLYCHCPSSQLPIVPNHS